MSSSGCERNWSTFALVHTKLRNRLSYDKLHKLVYVHYNLKLRIQLFQDEMQSLQDMQCHLESDSDPCSILMDCAMYDEDNPIMDWLCNSRSESVPTLDEYVDSDLDLEPPNPSAFIVEELGMDKAEVAAFKNVTFPKKRGKKRRLAFEEEEEEDFADDVESDSAQGSPTYVESRDNSYDDGDDNGEFSVLIVFSTFFVLCLSRPYIFDQNVIFVEGHGDDGDIGRACGDEEPAGDPNNGGGTNEF